MHTASRPPVSFGEAILLKEALIDVTLRGEPMKGELGILPPFGIGCVADMFFQNWSKTGAFDT